MAAETQIFPSLSFLSTLLRAKLPRHQRRHTYTSCEAIQPGCLDWKQYNGLLSQINRVKYSQINIVKYLIINKLNIVKKDVQEEKSE